MGFPPVVIDGDEWQATTEHYLDTLHTIAAKIEDIAFTDLTPAERAIAKILENDNIVYIVDGKYKRTKSTKRP